MAAPLEAMGQMAARMLIGLVFNDYQGPLSIAIDGCELNVRESTGKAPVLIE
jgi:DNA-binding LacI/PurR family transcriptional regulator